MRRTRHLTPFVLALPLLAACGAQPDNTAPATAAPPAPAPAAEPVAATAPPPAAAPGTARQQWTCGDETISLRADGERGVLVLTHARGELELPAAADADGAHADANGNAFRDTEGQAQLVLSGQPARACVQAPQAPPDAPAPGTE